MSIIRGLFFDLDGTLVDTLEPNIKAYQKAISSIGRSASREQLRETFGMRYDVFLKKLFPDIQNEEIQNIRKIKSEIYRDFLHLSKPNHELINLVKTLKADHITALVTMAQRQNAESVLENSKISNLFDYVITGDEINHAKPDPEAYLVTLKKTGLNPSEVLAFEDSKSGVDSAISAGISTVIINITSTK